MHYKFLNKIDSPSDLKRVSKSDLSFVADEIREMIIKVVSNTGGHLAPSLGTIELAIAIHYVFNAPEDKIIWDVGHQSYAHKILTGRRDRFDTIRQDKGISGFTRMSESPFDSFSTGHSSTSISAGLGFACAKKLKKETSKVVAVIGDGSMTAGLAYEGLNNAGDMNRDLIVILNDNDMSISKNVGALSSFLSRTFSSKMLLNVRKELHSFLKSIPKVGENVYQFASRLEEALKAFITPGMLFEAFNFKYFGPIKGHNLNHLINILNNIKLLSKPVLIHVITQKGKGYEPAEKNPVYFHGCGPFEVKTGNGSPKKPAPSFTEVFGHTIAKFAEKDERIVAVTAAMPEGTGLDKFAKLYPERFFDVGIAEQHGVTFAAGMAVEGFKPVVAIYSTFLQRAYDQILHDVCLEKLNVVFALDRAGIVGEDGPTHHGMFDLSYLRTLPNMIVMAPKDERELSRMLATALNLDGPAAVRYPRGSGTGAKLDYSPIPIGKAKVLEKGNDLLILGIGICVNEAVAASKILKKEKIDASVVDCRFVKPLDSDLILELAEKIPRIITVEDNTLSGGFGSAVIECLIDNGLKFRLKRIGMPDAFVEHAERKVIMARYGVDSAGITKAAIEITKI